MKSAPLAMSIKAIMRSTTASRVRLLDWTELRAGDIQDAGHGDVPRIAQLNRQGFDAARAWAGAAAGVMNLVTRRT